VRLAVNSFVLRSELWIRAAGVGLVAGGATTAAKPVVGQCAVPDGDRWDCLGTCLGAGWGPDGVRKTAG
jgi:hypothetical protein